VVKVLEPRKPLLARGRAADADVDDVADALARVTFPRIASHALGKVRPLVEYGVNLGYDSLSSTTIKRIEVIKIAGSPRRLIDPVTQSPA
jgi:hypothetical protein